MDGPIEKIKIGILGCGAIGSGIARSLLSELKNSYQLTSIYDIDNQKCLALERELNTPGITQASYDELLKKFR